MVETPENGRIAAARGSVKGLRPPCDVRHTIATETGMQILMARETVKVPRETAGNG